MSSESNDDFRVTFLHDKHHHSVRIFVYDTNLAGGFQLDPEQAIEVGRIGRMAKAYRDEVLGAYRDEVLGNDD